ncbi:hypothetical protein L3Q82_001095 [Scortum barcoo]|uniref:Uncharacterized protein n=1 Tax=Scortum barcoo TaxID=214431 RepID=A0ACB8WBD5_9TELE|nr:hypothetical protein L3Q82_001095 [Scortum barcoo]
MAVHRRFPSNLMELERCCKEEWAKLPKDSYVASVNLSTLAATAAANGGVYAAYDSSGEAFILSDSE